MSAEPESPKVGDVAIVIGLPPEYLDCLPQQERDALAAITGKTVSVVAYERDGRAVIQFVLPGGRHGTVWLAPQFLQPLR